MVETSFPKGAEWRKWDLHLHTPGTAKNDLFPSGADRWDAFIEKLESVDEISVLGITDYFSIENYEKVKGFQNDGRIAGKCIIPNIEMRILPVTGASTPINMHVLFDPDLESSEIEREFLRKLKFHYNGSDYSCIRSDLISLGRSYRSDNSLPEQAAWREGIGQFNVSFTDIKKVLDGNILSDRLLIGVSNSSDDGNSGIQHSSLAATRQEIYRLSDFIFSGNPADTAYFLGSGVDSSEKVMKDYGSLKPCVIGSDAHSLEKVCEFPNDRFTWIKADPSFQGLKQVINEPQERVFIGAEPPLLQRIARSRTKYIKNILITQTGRYDERHGIWFKDVSIPLNSELVAIIGNKGSGKSAIADVVSLCSNCSPTKDFSFLTHEKFKKKKLAANFMATIIWESGKTSEMNLNYEPEYAELPDVKYLPQGQFERLTNEIRTAEEFQREIEGVVFSHVPDSERLGALSFDELIQITTASVDSEIESYKGDIRDANKQIIDLEHKSTASYRAEIQNKLKRKQEELDSLVEPTPVSDPNEDPEKQRLNEAANGRIAQLKDDIRKLQDSLQAAAGDKKAALEALQALKSAKADIQQKKSELSRFVLEKDSQLAEFDIDINKVISISTAMGTKYGWEGVLRLASTVDGVLLVGLSTNC